MTAQEYCDQLEALLQDLDPDVRKEIVDYYAEALQGHDLDDSDLARMGTPEETAQEVLASFQDVDEAPAPTKKMYILTCTSPIWGVLWLIWILLLLICVVVVAAVWLCFPAAGVAGFVYGVLFLTNDGLAWGLISFAIGFFGVGLALCLVHPMLYLEKQILKFLRFTCKKIAAKIEKIMTEPTRTASAAKEAQQG